MKALVLSLLAIPLFYSCGGGEEVNSEDSSNEQQDTVVQEIVEEEVVNKYIIGTDVVGIFIIGNQVPALPGELKLREFTTTDLDDEGKEAEHRHNMIFNQLEDCVELIMDQGSGEHHEDRLIEEMIVISNYYETADSVSVGSTIEELNSIYAGTKFWYSAIHDRYFCETADMERVQFIIDPKMANRKPGGSGNRIAMSMNDFKAGAEIVKIRVH